MDAIALGRRAHALLQDETFHAVIDNIRTDAINRWVASPALDEPGREKIYQYVRMLDAIKNELTLMADNAKMAEAKAEQERRDRQFSQRNIIQD
jgi:hypothetical protein